VVLTLIGAGLAMLIVFCVIETAAVGFLSCLRGGADPMFRLALFRIRPFTAGNMASLLAGLGRGGLMFTLIIWLQGHLPADPRLQRGRSRSRVHRDDQHRRRRHRRVIRQPPPPAGGAAPTIAVSVAAAALDG
jgi:hypothetical protein